MRTVVKYSFTIEQFTAIITISPVSTVLSLPCNSLYSVAPSNRLLFELLSHSNPALQGNLTGYHPSLLSILIYFTNSLAQLFSCVILQKSSSSKVWVTHIGSRVEAIFLGFYSCVMCMKKLWKTASKLHFVSVNKLYTSLHLWTNINYSICPCCFSFILKLESKLVGVWSLYQE